MTAQLRMGCTCRARKYGGIVRGPSGAQRGFRYVQRPVYFAFVPWVFYAGLHIVSCIAHRRAGPHLMADPSSSSDGRLTSPTSFRRPGLEALRFFSFDSHVSVPRFREECRYHLAYEEPYACRRVVYGQGSIYNEWKPTGSLLVHGKRALLWPPPCVNP